MAVNASRGTLGYLQSTQQLLFASCSVVYILLGRRDSYNLLVEACMEVTGA